MAFLPMLGMAAEGSSAMSALAIGSTMLSAAGAVAQGNATKQAMDYNAQVLQLQAKSAQDQGAMQGANIVDQTRRKIGTAIASGAQSGIDPSSGSFRDLLQNTAAMGHLDALNAIYKGSVLGTGYRNQAAADIYAGNSAFDAGLIGAGTSLLKGVNTAYTSGSLSL